MYHNMKRIIALSFALLLIFTQTAAAVQSYDTFIKINNSKGKIDDGGQFIDFYTNQDNMTVEGKVYDPNADIENLTLHLDDISKEIGVFQDIEDGYRSFSIDIDAQSSTVFNSVYARVHKQNGELFESEVFSDENEGNIIVNNIIIDKQSPYFIDGPKTTYSESNVRIEFEINEEVLVDKNNFKLYEEDGTLEISNAIYNAYSYKDNDKFILGVEIDKSKIQDYTNYMLEVGSEIIDYAGNTADSSLAKMWLMEQSNPVFEVDTTEYKDGQDVKVKLLNVNNNTPAIVQGSSVVVDDNGVDEVQTLKEFKVVLHEEYDEINNLNFHKLYGHFEDKELDKDKYIEANENLDGKDDYELTGIPVDKTKRNKIALKYNDTTEVVFYWEPSEVNFWNHSYKITHNINNNPVIDVAVNDFVGNKNDLYIELLSQDAVAIGELRYIATVTDEYNEKISANEEVLRFSYENGKLYTDFNDKGINNQETSVKLVYDENSDGTVEKTEWLDKVRIDNQPPDPNVWYEGVETIDNTNYHVVKVNFNDSVKGSSIVENNFELKEYENESGVNPNIVVPIGDEYSDSYWEAKLYFSEDNFVGNIIVVRNIEDVVGFNLTEKITEFGIDTHISGTILDKEGNTTSDIQGEIIFVPDNLDLSQINFDEEDIYKHVQWVHIDNGYFDRWIKPGAYKIYNIEIKDEYNHKLISIDKTIEIPYTDPQEVYNFDIQIPQDNVFGKVFRENEEMYNDKLLILETSYLNYFEEIDVHDDIFEMFGKVVETDEYGNFSLYLSPGTYKVVGKQTGFSFIKPQEDYIFTVEEGNLDLSEEIVFPKDNVFGKVVDINGDSHESTHITIIDKDNGEFYETMADSLGNFGISLDDGNYIFASASIIKSETENGGLYFINKDFEVLNGEIVLIENKNPLEYTQIPKANLEIKLIQNEEIFKGDAEIQFVFDYEGQLHDPEAFTRTGTFEFYLVPGNYSFNELFAYNEYTNEHFEIENLNLEINIDENSNYTGENAYEIDMEDLKVDSSNVVITLKDENQNPMSGYGLSIYGIDSSMDEWRKTDSYGNIYLYLEPGLYKIPGYNLENGVWKELNYEFQVTNDHTTENVLNEVIIIKAPNVKGKVLDGQGNIIKYAWVGLEKLPDSSKDEYFSEHIGFNADENGEFRINLQEGKYLVNGIWNPNNDSWEEMNFKFDVVDSGTLTDIVIQKQSDNVKGYVFKKYDNETKIGDPFDGKSDYYGDIKEDHNNVWLVLREYGIDDEDFNNSPWLYEKWINVKEDGSFSILLDETKVYEAFAVSTPKKYIELNQNGEAPTLIYPSDTEQSLNLIITPPVPNLGGKLLDFDGNPIPNAFINIEKSDYTQWLNTETDEEGYFGINLKNGEEYIIRDINYYTGDNQNYDYSKENRITFNKSIVVSEGLNDIILRPNVKGNLNIGSLDITSNDYIGIGIRKVVDENDANYEDYQMNPWKYENWIQVKYQNQGDVGAFTAYLEDGKYEITGVSTPSGWEQINAEFVLDNSSHDIVNYLGDDTYELNIEYIPNVQGVILDKNGNPEVEAWVNIEKIVEYDTSYNGDYYNTWFGSNSDKNGQFSIKLSDGDYRVAGYSTRGYWENNNWINGKWVSVNYEFTVENGNLKDIESIEIKPNVTGYVKKYNKDTGSLEAVSYSWMKIKSADENWEADYDDWKNENHVNSDKNGQFTSMLEPGKYKVVEAGGYNVWMQLSINFEIDEDGNLIENEYVENGELIVKPQKPNVKGYVKDENGNILSNSHISIKPINAKENDWNNAKWIQSDENGYFELRLDNGDWKVAQISATGFWKKVYIPFTVDEESITSQVDNAVQNGILNVKPPTANLVGIVKDKEGNKINQKAWLAIKPSNAGTHDWEDSHSIEYKNYNEEYKFKLYLQPGDYKVVNVYGNNFNYETEIRFTIGNDGVLVGSDNIVNNELVVKPLDTNVEGSVYAQIDGNEKSLGYGWISVARYDNDGKQISMDGDVIQGENYYKEDGIYWHHTKWINTDENGDFSLRLNEGRYKVISVSGNGVWYKPFTEFTVNEGVTNIDIKQPGPNAVITIKNTGLNDAQAWIDIELNKNGYKNYIPVQLKSVNNGEYVFETRLENGDYVIKSFGTSSYWTEIEHEFTVNNEETLNNIILDFNQESKRKVNGRIDVNEKAWVAILPVVNGQVDNTKEKRWIQTSEDGSFMFKLDQGTTWAITDITTSQGYYIVNNPLNYNITIAEQDEQSPIEWIIDLNSL